MTSSTSSFRASRQLGPILLAAGLTAALLAAWTEIQGHLPEPAFRVDEDPGRLYWGEASAGPFHTRGDLRSAQLVLVGDSRVFCGIDAWRLERAGLGPVGLFWGGGADLLDLLVEVPAVTDARRLVVGISPLSIFTPRSEANRELRAIPRPRLDAEDFDGELLRWAEATRDLLLARGMPEREAAVFVTKWFGLQRRDAQRSSLTPRRIDALLADGVTIQRERLLRTVTTEAWDRAWFDVLDEHGSDEHHRNLLGVGTRDRRAERMAELAARAAELQADGFELTFVRVPVSPSIRAIEEEAFPGARMEKLCGDLGAAFLDYSDRHEFQTRDGTHLSAVSAGEFSRTLAKDLERLFEAGRR